MTVTGKQLLTTLEADGTLTLQIAPKTFDDPTGTDHEALGAGLRKALYNYMHGLGLDEDVRAWFPPLAGKKRGSVPRTTVDPSFVREALVAR